MDKLTQTIAVSMRTDELQRREQRRIRLLNEVKLLDAEPLEEHMPGVAEARARLEKARADEAERAQQVAFARTPYLKRLWHAIRNKPL